MVVPPWEENFIENCQNWIFLCISYFNLAMPIIMHYYRSNSKYIYIYIYIYISKFALKISNKKKSTKKREKFSRIKYILFLILHMMSNFYLIWITNKNTVVSHRKENFIENGKQRIFFYILYFNLAISSLCIISILVKIIWILFCISS